MVDRSTHTHTSVAACFLHLEAFASDSVRFKNFTLGRGGGVGVLVPPTSPDYVEGRKLGSELMLQAKVKTVHADMPVRTTFRSHAEK